MSLSTAIPLSLLIEQGAKSSAAQEQGHDDSYCAALDCSVSTTTATTESDEREECSTATYSFDDYANQEPGPANVYVRDFAYPEGSPLHCGHLLVDAQRRESLVSLSSSDFTGCQARALYEFVPETEYEIGMNEGDVVWVQYRQCPGWLVADVQNETGLIPESYVEFL